MAKLPASSPSTFDLIKKKISPLRNGCQVNSLSSGVRSKPPRQALLCRAHPKQLYRTPGVLRPLTYVVMNMKLKSGNRVGNHWIHYKAIMLIYWVWWTLALIKNFSILKNSWFTLLVSGIHQSDIYHLFLSFFSIIYYYKILNIVPCAIL